jgi:hypothetical protein
MRDLRPVAIVTRQVEVLEDAERHAGGDALARRRDLVQRRAAIGEADRIDPVGLVLGEIVVPQCAAGRAGMTVHRLRELAAIEGLALALGDLGERLRLLGKLPDLTRLRGAAVGQEIPDPVLLAAQPVDRALPLARDHVGNAEAVRCILDRRLEQVGERQLAVAAVQGRPERHSARHGDAAPTGARHLVLAGVLLGRHQRRRMS